jgi:L,D-transpeptidase-like protein
MRRHAVILAAALAWLIGVEAAEAKLDILVDKVTQRMLVIQDGYIRYMWPVSTGRDELATPNGVYTPQRMERNWFSSAYYNSPMPYSIFFHNGYAIHGSYAIDKLGGPASHGCVRLHPHHAAVLFDMVQQEGPANTTIEITEDARPGEPSPPGREAVPLPGREPAVPSLAGQQLAAPSLAGRQFAAAPGAYPPAPRVMGYDPPPPRVIRYREPAEMPEPLAAPRRNRSIVAKNMLPPKPAPSVRRMANDVRPAASAPRAPGGAAEADPANASRPPDEPSVARPKPRLAEVTPAEPAQPAQPQRVPAKQTQSGYGFKLLPTSCWNGGASRWRWWSSGQETSCK